MTSIPKSTVPSEIFEYVVFEHDTQKNDIEKALQIVKQFIIRKKLILTGGMAIDLALRLKGDSLYDDKTLPDYDFYSTQHAKDAYELAQILHDKDLPNISAINALHITTMRVRVNYVAVADITYIPSNIYEKIPTLLSEGFIIEHPHYKMINQHRSLSLPYEHPPFETIMHRWKKDIQRFNMLWEHYSISREISPSIDEASIQEKTITIPIKYLENNCLGGYGAILYYKKELLLAKSSFCRYKQSHNLPITILTENFDDTIQKVMKDHPKAKKTYYHKYLDIINRRCTIQLQEEIYEIIDTKDSLISVNSGKFKIEGQDFPIVNPQQILCQYLFFYHINPYSSKGLSINSKIYLQAYCELFEIVQKKKIWPTAETYGSTNVPDEVKYGRQMISRFLEADHKDPLKPPQFKPNNSKSTSLKSNQQVWNYNLSGYFQIDGSMSGT